MKKQILRLHGSTMTTTSTKLYLTWRIRIGWSSSFAAKLLMWLPWANLLSRATRRVPSILAVKIGQGSVLKSYLMPVLTEQSTIASPLQSPSLNNASKKHELVTGAEIFWTLKVVASHFSYLSSMQAGELFRWMFPDSEVAKAFSCGE